MPTYEYECAKCKSQFEYEQRITEEPLKRCIKCGSTKVRRLITQGNFILKGSGWYSDLYSGPSNQTKTSEGSTKTKDAKGSKAKKSTGDKKAGSSNKSSAKSTTKKAS